ncbi:MAG: hypothetical protein E2P02_22970 [Acidobacteria bacterium]|nr:MAG: hypothetical protein E2P02_22970 [Acidobacteriota bacterium]
MRIWAVGVFGLVLATAGFSQDDWPTHGGDAGGTKHSTLDQIRRDNVHQLAPLWTWETGDEPIAAARMPFAGREIKPGKFQGTPVVVDGTLYIATSYTQVAAPKLIAFGLPS